MRHVQTQFSSVRSAAAMLAWAVLVWCSACQRPTSEQPVASGAASEADIPWIKGDVDAAFAAARAQHKPVLLYWGAVWCPYCQQLKATVFSRPEFVAKTHLFVPVYLDGDDARAQKWGENFRVQGYPTLLVLDADKREVMRLAGGMDLNQYAALLDTALGNLQPIEVTLAEAGATPTLSANICTRLAFHAWALEDLPPQEFAARAAQLTDAAQRCMPKEPIASARLFVFAAYFQAESERDKIERGRIPSERLRAAIDTVQAVLQQQGGDAKLADALQTLDETFFKAVKAAGAGVTQSVQKSYAAAMDAEVAATDLAEADHLAALGRKLLASRVLSADGRWPEQYVRETRTRIDAVLKQSQTPYVRSGILNAVLNIYDELQLHQAAYDLVKAELPNADHKYYLKADLAAIAEQLGHKEEAVELRKQAYSEAQGASTRFQWGVDYASALLRLQPEAAQQITEVTSEVLAELDGPDRIYRRGRLRLERLDRELRTWNQAAHNCHAEVLKALHARMQQICAKIPQQEAARTSCDGFLSKA